VKGLVPAAHFLSARSRSRAIYVVAQTVRDVVGAHHPGASWVGIALAAVTVLTMPPLAEAKRRLGRALGSSATTSESRQTLLCAYLFAGLLVGLIANALAGWWWADPAVALGIGGLKSSGSRRQRTVIRPKFPVRRSAAVIHRQAGHAPTGQC
jgi:hypothetical protein